MVLYGLAPPWFVGYDAAMEFFFFLVALLISLFAFSVHRKTGQKGPRSFGWAFLLISLSYIVQSLSNLFILAEMLEVPIRLGELYNMAVAELIGAYAHMFLMVCGLALLLNVSEGLGATLASAAVAVIAIAYSGAPLSTFYLIGSVYLFLLSARFIRNYRENRKPPALLVAAAFILLFFSDVVCFVEADLSWPYVVCHLLQLVAYLILLANFWIVLRKRPR
jgi:hypothetical protein